MKREAAYTDGGRKVSSRPCYHNLTGRTQEPKHCTLNYECYHCGYDQWLDALDNDIAEIRLDAA